MVFFASDTDLELFAQNDLEEMQKVGSVPGKVHVVAQVARRRYSTPVRFYIRKGRREPVARPRSPKSTGNPLVLASFLRWARDTYPADRYMLVLWGHAFGLGFGRNYGDALTIGELGKVLKQFAATLPSGKLDVLGCDACSMSKAEAAFEFRDAVGVLVASQLGIPYMGWPYDRILQTIVSQPDIETPACGQAIVDEFIDSYVPPEVGLSSLNLEEGQQLDDVIGRLSDSLLAAWRSKRQRDRIRTIFRKAARTPGFERPLIDLRDLCKKLTEASINRAVGTAARATVRTLRAVVDHRSLPARRDGLNGLGIYAPFVAHGSFKKDLQVGRSSYTKLALMKRTAWDDLVLPRRPRRRKLSNPA